MTVNALLQVGGPAVVALLTVGPVLGLLLSLNSRDRRRDVLFGLVGELAPKDLSGLIAVHVRCSLFSSRSKVTVEMPYSSRDEIWEATARWSLQMPPRTRLLVKGTMDRGGPGQVILEANRPASAYSPPRHSPALG